eukprot:1144159-Pelagomonas_calceolata.AAC.3
MSEAAPMTPAWEVVPRLLPSSPSVVVGPVTDEVSPPAAPAAPACPKRCTWQLCEELSSPAAPTSLPCSVPPALNTHTARD